MMKFCLVAGFALSAATFGVAQAQSGSQTQVHSLARPGSRPLGAADAAGVRETGNLPGSEAQLIWKIDNLQAGIDRLIQQDKKLHEEIQQQNGAIKALQERVNSISRPIAFGTNGMSLINMVQQMYDKAIRN